MRLLITFSMRGAVGFLVALALYACYAFTLMQCGIPPHPPRDVIMFYSLLVLCLAISIVIGILEYMQPIKPRPVRPAILTIYVTITPGEVFAHSFPAIRDLSNRLQCNVQAPIGNGHYIKCYYGGKMMEWCERNDWRQYHNY